jgi:psp operon transcriptional activator
MISNAGLLGSAPAFIDALERVSAVAPLDRPVLIIGARGTGKELIAQRVHALSKRWGANYVTLNCAALPESLLEAELFGAEAGAYTGATKSRTGRFEDADGGTLFLDEIATLSAQAQEKLLRVIEYGQLQRLGANKTVQVDVRVIGATNEDLPDKVLAGTFRADLLDRLSFEVVTLPTLAARPEDIMALADNFARRMAVDLGWSMFPGFSKSAQAKLLAHEWPGNIRELKNVAERAVYRWGDDTSEIDTIIFDPFASPWRPSALAVPRREPGTDFSPDAVTDYRAAVNAFEKNILEKAMQLAGDNQRTCAINLGLTYDQLRHALKKNGLL